MSSSIPTGDLKKLLNRRVFGKTLLGREPYVFRDPLRDSKGSVIGFTPLIMGVSYQYIALQCPAPRKLFVTGRGIGKSDIIIGNSVPHHVFIQPFFDQASNLLSRPLPCKVILVGNYRETARKLQEKMRRDSLSHPFLASLVAEHTQTELRTRHGSHIYVRTAGNDGSSIRGLHSEILTNERGHSVKGRIHVYIDEAAFMRAKNLLEEVVEPMMILNPNSTVTITTTPYGEEGEVWKAWSDVKSMDCLQPYEYRKQFVERRTADDERVYRAETFKVYPKLDPAICARCMAVSGWKRFNIPTAENPYMVPEKLFDRRESLIRNGLELVWNQEHMGLFQKAAGLFFPPATWLKCLDDDADFFEEDELRVFPGRRTGKFFLGVDSSSGIVTKGADFTALWLWEEVKIGPDLHYFARMVHRWRKPPEAWDAKLYDETKLLNFVIDYVRFLSKKLSVKKLTIGFGFGQGIHTGLQNDDDVRIDYYTDSEPELLAGFVWFRALMEMGRIHIPARCAPGGSHGWLSDEAGRLGITDGSVTSGLRFKVYKMSGWGSGKTVDALFAGMYGLKPTMRMMGNAYGISSSTMVDVGSPRGVGGSVRELGVAGVRELSKN